MRTDTKILKNNLKMLSKSAGRNTDIVVSIKDNTLKVETNEVSFTQFIGNTIVVRDAIAIELKLSDFKKAVNIIKNIQTDISIANEYIYIDNTKMRGRISDYIEQTEEKAIKIDIAANYFTDALGKCIFYSDKAFKPILRGILFDFQKGKLILASTDGKILNKETLVIDSNVEKKITLSTEAIKSLLELKKQNRKTCGQDEFSHASFSIKIYDLYVEFMYKNGDYEAYTFTSNIKEGKYPDVDRVMPDFDNKKTRTISFDKNEAIACIKQLSHLCKENTYKNLYLNMKNGKIVFYGYGSKSEGSIFFSVDATYDCEDDTIVCFNYKYLLDVLSITHGNTIDLKCVVKEDKEKGFVLSYIKEINSIYLIMLVNADANEIRDKINNTKSIEDTQEKEHTNTAMRLYASEKEDKKYSEKQGNKYLKGYCFENKNGKLCQVGKFFYRAGYFLDAIKRIGFDINRVQIIDSKSLAS